MVAAEKDCLTPLTGKWPRSVLQVTTDDGSTWIGLAGAAFQDGRIAEYTTWEKLKKMSDGMEHQDAPVEGLPRGRWWRVRANVRQAELRIQGVVKELRSDCRVLMRWSRGRWIEGKKHLPGDTLDVDSPTRIDLHVGDKVTRLWAYPAAARGSHEMARYAMSNTSMSGGLLIGEVDAHWPGFGGQAWHDLNLAVFDGLMVEAAGSDASCVASACFKASITGVGWLMRLRLECAVEALPKETTIETALLKDLRRRAFAGLTRSPLPMEKWSGVDSGYVVSAPVSEWPAWQAWLESNHLTVTNQGEFDPSAPWNRPIDQRALEHIAGWSAPAATGRTLRDFQKDGIAFLVSRGMRAILADDMGLGKTAQALAAAQYQQARRVLIVAPASVSAVWRDEILAWGAGDEDSIQILEDAHDVPRANTRWLIAAYDKLVATARPFFCKTTDEAALVADAMTRAVEAQGFSDDEAAARVSLGGKDRRQLRLDDTVGVSDSLYIVILDVLPADRHGAWKKWVWQRRGEILDRLAEWGPDVAIFDEAHRLKNSSAKRNSAAIRISASSGGCLLLSGTPIQNRTAEPAVLLHVLDPRAYQQIKNSERIEIPRLRGMLAPLMLRRRKDDVLKELPPVIEQVVHLDGENYREIGYRAEDLVPLRGTDSGLIAALTALRMTGESALIKQGTQGELAWREQREEYAVFRAAWAVGPEKETDSPHNPTIVPALGLFEMLRNHLAQEKARDPRTIDLVADVVEEKGSVVVFTAHHDATDILADRLQTAGYKVAVIDGRTPPTRRGAIVNNFQQGEIQCLIGGMDAAGEGLTLTRADTAIFLEMAQKPSTLRQARDRLHRIGQQSVVQAIYLVSDNPVDRFFKDLCLDKAALTSAVLEESVQVLGEAVRVDSPAPDATGEEAGVVQGIVEPVSYPAVALTPVADRPIVEDRNVDESAASRNENAQPSQLPKKTGGASVPADDDDPVARKREQTRLRAQRFRQRHAERHRAYMRDLMRKIRAQKASAS